MSSLWTPDGERTVPPAPSTPPEDEHLHGEAEGAEIDPAEAARYRQEMEELEKELLAAPVGDVIANHCYGIFQLAAMHLGQQPPHLTEARVAIDALGGVIDAVGERLGGSSESLQEALAQIRLAFVQISGAHSTPEDEPS